MLLSSLNVWLLQVFIIPIACAQHDLQQAVGALTAQLSNGAIVTFPWEPRWDALQARASFPRLAPHYTVVVEVATEEDVQATVSLANRFNIPFLAVSGTHGWTTTLNSLPYGIQINLRKLNTTTLSPDGKSAIVGGGTLQYEITRSLFAKGKAAGKTVSRLRFRAR
jgi:FAD/FMN-containing dehydrogenase